MSEHPATGIPVDTRPPLVGAAPLHVGSRIGVHHVTSPIDPYEAQAAAAAAGLAETSEAPATHPDILTEIAELPHSIWALQREVKALLDLLAETFTPRPYANLATLSGVNGTPLGTGSWAVAIPKSLADHGAIEVVDVLVWASQTTAIELHAAAADSYASTPPSRLIGTVEITSGSTPTQPFPTHFTLHPGEALFLVTFNAIVQFDFSCRYRYMRS